ncbi:unnamed protein product [Rhodiola kirilowii]
MSLVTEEIRAKATEIYHGNEIGQEKTKLLLKEVGLPNGLLPLQDIEEVGRVEETGFVWLKQKKKVHHKFEQIGRLATYDTEITAIADRGSGRIRKLTGVKSKELGIWLTLTEICVDKPPTGKIVFKGPSGLYRTFPVSAFEIEEGEGEEEEKKKEDVKEEEKKVEVEPVKEEENKVEVEPVKEEEKAVTAAKEVLSVNEAIAVKEV